MSRLLQQEILPVRTASTVLTRSFVVTGVSLSLSLLSPTPTPAATENSVSAGAIIEYGGDPEYNESRFKSGLGFVEEQWAAEPPDGQFMFLMNANAQGLKLTANVASHANQKYFTTAHYSALALARVTDTVTILGTTDGRIQYHFDFHGELEYAWRRDGGAVTMAQGASYARLEMFWNADYHAIAQEILEIPSFPAPRTEVYQELLPVQQSHSLSFPYVGGQSVDITFALNAGTYADVDNVDGGEFAGSTWSNFGSTAELLGVTVYDAQGNLIPNPVIQSASGITYPIIVPEPSAIAAAALLTTLLTTRTSRRRRPA